MYVRAQAVSPCFLTHSCTPISIKWNDSNSNIFDSHTIRTRHMNRFHASFIVFSTNFKWHWEVYFLEWSTILFLFLGFTTHFDYFIFCAHSCALSLSLSSSLHVWIFPYSASKIIYVCSFVSYKTQIVIYSIIRCSRIQNAILFTKATKCSNECENFYLLSQLYAKILDRTNNTIANCFPKKKSKCAVKWASVCAWCLFECVYLFDERIESAFVSPTWDFHSGRLTHWLCTSDGVNFIAFY